VYARLNQTLPELPRVRFSNGDLYLDNFIVRDRRLSGVIDFEMASFSDPIYEFLLPFYVHPELYNRGLEERYCAMMGFDAESLRWYHALEHFDTLHWVLKRGKPFVHHTEESLTAALQDWLG
jgi:aminoglycoside phosphotransferase (APT) family kinase protein